MEMEFEECVYICVCMYIERERERRKREEVASVVQVYVVNGRRWEIEEDEKTSSLRGI